MLIRNLTVFLFSMFCFSPIAFSQILVDITHSGSSSETITYGGAFSLSEVDYEVRNRDIGVERKTLGLGLYSKVTPEATVMGQVGYTFQAEDEDGEWDGNGFMLGGGLNFLVHRKEKMTFLGYGLLNYINENYDYDSGGDGDLTMMDMHLGGIAEYALSNKIIPYGALEFLLYSDGEIEMDGSDVDIERDDRLVLRAGLKFIVDKFVFRPELAIAGEQTITLNVTLL